MRDHQPLVMSRVLIFGELLAESAGI